MDSTPTKERHSKWRAEYAADLDRQYDVFKRKVLADFDRRWSAQTIDVSPLPRKAAPRADDRQTETLSRREMVLEVLPEFGDQDFIRRDVEAKVIERWPDAEPKTKRERKTFTTAIATVMTDLVRKGQLEVKEGESRFEPRVYRVKDI